MDHPRALSPAAGHVRAISETPHDVGRAVAALAADPDVARWNGESLSSDSLAQEYTGKPADSTGYR